MKKSFYLFLSVLTAGSVQAQHHHDHNRCLTDQYYQQQIQEDPSILQRQQQFDADVQQVTQSGQFSGKKSQIHIIPVVFHVFHAGGSENISKAQILSQIDVLNQDFNNVDLNRLRSVFWGSAANAEIEFRLATIDPSGNCTDGIVRIYDPVTENGNDGLKRTSVWPTDKYFNIWVVKDINKATSQLGTILGYAQFPWIGSFGTDGILVRSDNIGNIGTATNPVVGVPQHGRTTVHEVGHWLGLYHPFQDSCFGGDGVDDTPPVMDPNFGNCIYRNSCTNDNPDLPDMVENYMDYADGACMSAFTIGQKLRMKTTLSNWRPKLTSQSNLVATGTADPYNYVAQTTGCGPQAGFYSRNTDVCANGKVTFVNDAYNYSGAQSTVTYNWLFEGGSPNTFTGINPPQITYAESGNFDVTLIAEKNGITDTFVRKNYVNVYNTTAMFGAGYQQGFEWPSFPVDGWVTWSTSFQVFKRREMGSGTIEGTAALMITNNNVEDGARFYLESPTYDVSMLSAPLLSFRYAFTQRRINTVSSNDQMIITYSSNCGQTWKPAPLFSQSGTALNTTGGAPFVSVAFSPTDASQWRKVDVALNSIPQAERNNVRFRFEFRSRGGHNFYIDAINIGFSTDIAKFYSDENNFKVYPNPSTGVAKISLNLAEAADVKVEVLDLYGRMVEVLAEGGMQGGEQLLEFNTLGKDLSNGVYLVRMSTGGSTFTRKLMLIGQ